MASKITASISIPRTMRAWVHHRTGSPSKVLSLKEDISIPTLPTDTSVLVRVSHVAFHPGIIILMHFVPSWLRRMPAVPETDFSGVIVSCGKNVPVSNGPRDFKPGTPVFGSLPVKPHLGTGQGALGEYIAIEAAAIARKPTNVSFAEASGLGVSAHTALVLVEAAEVSKDAKILINSPCGGVGHFATQLLRHRNPTARITGICSGHNHALALQLGCTDTIDHTSFPNAEGQTLVQYLAAKHGSDEEKFDIIFDAYGSQDLWICSAKYLKPGKDHPYVTVGPKMGVSITEVPGFLWKMIMNSTLPTWLGGVPRPYKQISAFTSTEAIERCKELAQAGEFNTHFGEIWDMGEAPGAYEVMGSGHARGKVVVKIWEPEEE
ncbi:oxidoreductase [Nannizzia gypsea CBS 118893]|uniref:Oxidoreductase n=1 Tax=Arthroderma gypseum (strain ATCC MYA-4604 / CBS 118893) TaxID=535722 RepID=E5R3F0_ARTGP|nr:oxidoreductase [Nannizzia gypsea CBS 118893]EFQ97965.1 oxidoreductase [Nannizzia gypsea CBS 118893]